MRSDEPTRDEQSRVESALRRALRETGEEYPISMPARGALLAVSKRRSNPGARLLAGLAVGIAVALVGASLLLRTSSNPPAGSPQASATSSGTGVSVFEGPEYSFAYPSNWRTISSGLDETNVNRVDVVLGTGSWTSGCQTTANGESCGPDAAVVSGDQIVVKVWRQVDGPQWVCTSSEPADATLGSNAVLETVENAGGRWQLRRPGNEFGEQKNVIVDAWFASPEGRVLAEQLIASLRWAPSLDPVLPTCS
jgi:hypothetical protein